MSQVKEVVAELSEIAQNPGKQLDKFIQDGKRVIGVSPYHNPEELVYAAGAIPFGVWGAVGQAIEARQYFPPFYCSICQMSLEMGLTHKLDQLSGMMITTLCDTLKAFTQNWKAGVQDVPLIFVSQPQNNQCEAGKEYVLRSYTEVKDKIQECAHHIISDEELRAAINLYNEWRKAMREFIELAGKRPTVISPIERAHVISASYFMDKADHLEKLKELNEALSQEPESLGDYKPIVLSGIYQDIPAILDLLEEHKFTAVADDLAKESRNVAVDVQDTGDALPDLSAAFSNVEADSLVYDPNKKHIDKVISLAQDNDAKGIVILLAKFCDPEEFDAPLIVKAAQEQNIPAVVIEIDQSTESYEQANTKLETFAEILN